MDLLSEIINKKRQRVEAAKKLVSLGEVLASAHRSRKSSRSHALVGALNNENQINIIAEFKRRSPSKGEINHAVDPVAMAHIYEAGGAAAVSLLTEKDYFDGSLDDLRAVKSSVELPVLCKDFIFDEYQVYESAGAGADALLLIVAALDDEMLVRLRRITEDELGMDALVEVHTSEELDRAVSSGARLIGVNNRNLRTFSVSIATSEQLARAAPHDATLVSESGLNAEAVRKLRAIGYRGFLVGEALMRAEDPKRALIEFTQRRKGAKIDGPKGSVQVKICGITSLEDARAAIAAGADMLGFNFYRPSPRFIEPQNARAIIETLGPEIRNLARTVTMVGVFVNEPSVESLVRIVEQTGVDAVQLHGEESVEFCQGLKELLHGRPLIKVLRVSGKFEPAEMPRYEADAIMLDAFDEELRGGTGRVFKWSIARRLRETVPRLFLAGGLSPENVAEAIAEVQPYAVDACSALESLPGRKDAELMKAFVRAAQSG